MWEINDNNFDSSDLVHNYMTSNESYPTNCWGPQKYCQGFWFSMKIDIPFSKKNKPLTKNFAMIEYLKM